MTGLPWWKHAVFYQIYPRSFKDSAGNGIGDLQGIIQKLDYLHDLGVDALWITPCFPSPMMDFGYDITDYTAIYPDFGTMDTMDELIRSAHNRDQRIILDFVPNHTSDQHPWFLEARASRRSARRDWYIWADPAPQGGPPNNWLSYFGGSAWEWDENSRQYYLHSFFKEQPDLNWRNAEVQESMQSVLRFWLERGVDGFRVDAVLPIIKDSRLRDNPTRTTRPIGRDIGPPGMQLRSYSSNRPELHGLLRQFRSLVDSYPGQRILIGEVYTLDPDIWSAYHGRDDEFHLVLNVSLPHLPWEAKQIRQIIEAFDACLPAGALNTLVLGSHDENRIASRWGEQQARVAAMMLMTLPGVPFVYYGDEIGILDGVIPEEKRQDPWPERSGLSHLSRDPARTPMQWDPGPGAGFSPVDESGSVPEPWLPIHPRYPELNIATQLEDPHSLLNLYRRLIALRRESPVLKHGGYGSLEGTPDDTYIYVRQHLGERLLIALNFASEARAISLPGADGGHILISSRLDREGAIDPGQMELGPDEGLLIQLAGDPSVPSG